MVDQSLTPGEIVISENQLIVGCGTAALQLGTVQPEGTRKMSATDYLRGRKPQVFV